MARKAFIDVSRGTDLADNIRTKPQVRNNNVVAGGGSSIIAPKSPALPTRPKPEQKSEEFNTSRQGNAEINIATMYKPRPDVSAPKPEIEKQVEITKQVPKTTPSPAPMKPLVIPSPALIPPPPPVKGIKTPVSARTKPILRPDGITEVLGIDKVVREEVGRDGRLIVDPVKDAGFDIHNPPESVEKLRDEFEEHILSGKDEADEPFYPTDETYESLLKDGLGSRVVPKPKEIIVSDVENETAGDNNKAKEKIITPNEAQNKLSAQDYIATITEVMDSNRIRVSLSYNDGVNLYQHKGDDEVAKKFKNFRVNYIKSNILERYKTYMVKDNQYYLITNDKLGIDGKERVVKLKQPLRNTNVNDKVMFVEKRLPDYQDTIRLEPFVQQEDEGIFLRLPNFNSTDNPINFQGTNYKTHTDLLSDSDEDSRDIERILTSGSLLDIKPNVDYQKTTKDLNFEADDTGFGNFVNFSSAERRVKNFEKKIILIESHSAESKSLLSVSSSAARILAVEKKRQRVINSFDPFEDYMYFESSSYRSGSDGQFHDTAWPKTTSTKPYVLAHTTSSYVTSSYLPSMINSASDYDQRNMNSLRNSLPLHVNADTKNNPFLEFMDMTGQQFDEVWSYTKHLTDVNTRVENISEGISKDVARHYAESLGLELTSGNDLLILPQYLLGKNQDGTDLYDEAQKDITEEIWKRILANLPFFIKTKGTARSLKGLLNCYGIPSSMLRVREYGGPDKGTGVNYEIKRKFTYALDFKASQYIKTLWKTDATTSMYPETVEVRFRTPYSAGSSGSMVILQKENDWAISLQDNGTTDDYGHLKFEISGAAAVYDKYITSSLLPLYNDDMWSVMLTRTDDSNIAKTTDTISSQSIYELTVKQYDSTRQRIIYKDSQSLQTHTSSLATDVNNITGSSLNAAFTGSGFVYLGGSGSAFGNQFSGSLMEYRLWSEPLTASAFDNHVRTPKAYNGNTYSSSYENLLVRYELNDNISLSSSNASQTASNTAHLLTYERGVSGSQVDGYTGNFYRSIVDQEKMRVPDMGSHRRNATKIRIEDTTIKQPLVVNERKEKSSDDFAPIDSNMLGVYFSPTDVVNEDVGYSIADFNFDDYIGDPRDEFKSVYKDLRDKRRGYFKRYSNSNNFWDYLRILKFYDRSVFTQIRHLVPARANASLGVLIEPNILERSKQIIGDKPKASNRYYENAGHFDEGIKVTRYITGSDDNYFEVSGEYNTYNGLINIGHFDTGSSLGFLNARSLMILDALDPRSEYGNLYATASITSGSHNNIFTEVLQPNLTSSRFAENNEETRYFYSSSYSASIGTTLAYSSSRVKSDVQSIAHDSSLFRTFYQGVLLTKDNTIDGKEPIEVNQVAPTTIVTQDSDISKLRTE